MIFNNNITDIYNNYTYRYSLSKIRNLKFLFDTLYNTKIMLQSAAIFYLFYFIYYLFLLDNIFTSFFIFNIVKNFK